MKKLIAALAVLLCVGASGLKAQLITPVSNLTNIPSEYTFGTGTNSSAMVIQWNDGMTPISIAWRFNWNTSESFTTSLDMIAAVAGTTYVYSQGSGGSKGDLLETYYGADSRLTFEVVRYSFGDAVYSIDFSDEGMGTRNRGAFLTGTYWSFLNVGGEFNSEAGENTFAGSYNAPGVLGTPDWEYSWSGASDRGLSNGSWDGYYFVVPEPSTWALLVLSAFGFGIWRIRRATRRV